MIKSLSINNFALIDQTKTEFGSGLNILTGETGAGKSILIDAIDLAFGARASKEQIKTGEDKALIELTVELSKSFPINLLSENGIETDDNTLVISREITHSATRSRINGVLITQSYLQTLREYLIDIHSQHETYNYLQPRTHIDLLDQYGDKQHQKLTENIGNIYSEYKQTSSELDFAGSNIQEKEQRLDFLKFQISEIENAKIENPDEYESLMQERLVLLNAEELKDLSFSSYSCLYSQDSSIIDILGQIENKLVRASELDKNLSEHIELITSSVINLKDAADGLRNYSESLETDNEKLVQIEERIDVLDKLKRKYGPSLSDILDNLEKFQHELIEIEINSENIEKLSQKLKMIQENLKISAGNLSDSRKKLASVLSDLIQKELIKLEMPKVQFFIKVEDKNEILSKGKDDVEFLISPNSGEPLKSLAKIASGGEISRVMLAVKTILAKADRVDTVIFDEIDTGTSGKTSQVIAEELVNLSLSHQILCITHQPMIAAMADQYFYISKLQSENKTSIIVHNLNQEERISAISKLASGSSDDQDALNFANKLIQQANEFKSRINLVKV
ncbi:MAG: DNA repair protein RecN [Candidatus Gastranaerophilales bacterium]|nr:DNA repair protein RecN [Candidatus Gastranaerophilales bacterium]